MGAGLRHTESRHDPPPPAAGTRHGLSLSNRGGEYNSSASEESGTTGGGEYNCNASEESGTTRQRPRGMRGACHPMMQPRRNNSDDEHEYDLLSERQRMHLLAFTFHQAQL